MFVNDNPNPLSLMNKYMLWLIAASFTLITGDRQYLEDAVKAGYYVMKEMTKANGGVMTKAPEGDGGLFHGIFFRYFVKLANEKTLSLATRKDFHQFLTHSATIMAKEGIHPTTMLYGGKWREALQKVLPYRSPPIFQDAC